MQLREVKFRIPTGKTVVTQGFEEETRDRFERHELLIHSVLLIMVITAISTLIDLFSYRLQTQSLISDRYKEANQIIGTREGVEEVVIKSNNLNKIGLDIPLNSYQSFNFYK